MKRIYGYIVATVVAVSMAISTLALSQVNSLSDELELAQAKSKALSEVTLDQFQSNLERIRKIHRTVTIESRPSSLERSTAGRIHWYALEEPGIATR